MAVDAGGEGAARLMTCSDCLRVVEWTRSGACAGWPCPGRPALGAGDVEALLRIAPEDPVLSGIGAPEAATAAVPGVRPARPATVHALPAALRPLRRRAPLPSEGGELPRAEAADGGGCGAVHWGYGLRR